MRSPCDPPTFDEQDWSQFDFSRWHVDGLKLDDTSAALADLAERFFNSDEWRQRFQATLPGLQRTVLALYRDQIRELKKARTAIAQDLDTRATEARLRAQDFRRSIGASAAPPVVKPDPKTFRLAVKVAAEDGRIGLPGLIVRLIDPRNQQAALVETLTDRDGNAVFSVPPEIAKELDKSHATLEVGRPGGKPLQKLPGAVCIRLNQTETKVIAVPDSEEVEPHKAAALASRTEREARAQNLAARVDRLKEEREARLRDMDCRLANAQAMIAALQQTRAPASKGTAAGTEQVAPPQGETPGTEQPTTPSQEGRSPTGPKQKRKKP